MNTGAFGENFPYSNFHDLNMDWIIKIAKDFLDQYTHIQDVIASGEESLTNLTEEGLASLTAKAEELEGLLDQWYETHSADIAQQLASAIADFNTAATNKSNELLDSWPDDYSELVTGYNNLKNGISRNGTLGDRSVYYTEPGILLSTGKWSTALGNHAVFPVNSGDTIRVAAAYNTSSYIAFLTAYTPYPADGASASFSQTYTSRIVFYSTEREFVVPSDCKFIVVGNRNGDWEDIYPVELSINGVDYACNIREKLNELSKSFVESANFNLDYISIGADGYIYLNHNTGVNHLNFVRCKSDLEEIGSVVFPYYTSAEYPICRVFFENPNGSVLRCQIDTRVDGSNNYIQIANYLNSTYVNGLQSTVPARDAGYHELRITKIGRSLFYYVDDTYVGYNTMNEALAEKVKIFGVAFRGDTTNNSRYGKPTVYPPIRTFAHMSIDDRIACLADITTNAGTYTSIFDNAELALYKELHEKYGCKFTLELFKQNAQSNPTFSVSQTTNAFKNEFIANSSWLKFAYHSPDPDTYITTMSVSDLVTDVQPVFLYCPVLR